MSVAENSQKYPTSSIGSFAFHSSSVIGVLLGKNTLTVSMHPSHFKFTATMCFPSSSVLVGNSSLLLIATVKKIFGSQAYPCCVSFPKSMSVYFSESYVAFLRRKSVIRMWSATSLV